MPVSSPANEEELLARAAVLAGESIAEVAQGLGLPVPADLSKHKGWVGMLIERALGASAGSRPEPDFEHLGVELKTLPVDRAGKPCESTFVCTISLGELCEMEWEDSRVRRKLSRVLWVPVQGERERELRLRRFGTPLIWSPDADELSALRFDWEELAGLVTRFGVDAITGHAGRFLQVRPKARDASVRRHGFAADGASIDALPRGFYLRPSFTFEILRRHFAL